MDEQIRKANEFWAEARDRVISVSREAGLEVSIEGHDDQFLYDLFDDGEYIPSDGEIIAAVEEYLAG